MAAQNTAILEENATCWRLADCKRARVLIDGADYFLALRRALLKAERDVFIVGWDIDSRTPLVGPAGAELSPQPRLLPARPWPARPAPDPRPRAWRWTPSIPTRSPVPTAGARPSRPRPWAAA
jgi:hypothetical protein